MRLINIIEPRGTLPASWALRATKAPRFLFTLTLSLPVLAVLLNRNFNLDVFIKQKLTSHHITGTLLKIRDLLNLKMLLLENIDLIYMHTSKEVRMHTFGIH